MLSHAAYKLLEIFLTACHMWRMEHDRFKYSGTPLIRSRTGLENLSRRINGVAVLMG